MATNSEMISNGSIYLDTNKRTVQSKLYLEIYNFVKDVQESLQKGRAYKLKSIYGSKIWKKFTFRKKIDAGFIMSHLVATKKAVHAVIEPEKGSSRVYSWTAPTGAQWRISKVLARVKLNSDVFVS